MFDVIKKRYIELISMGNISEDAMRIYSKYPEKDNFYESLVYDSKGDSCYWEDIEYDNKNNTEWRAVEHYVRMLKILTSNPLSRLNEDEAYREKLIKALNFWLTNDFTNPNWWCNDIGVPKNIGDITLLLSPVLKNEIKEKAVKIISRGSMATRSDISKKWTGANFIWGGVNTIKHALLTDNEELLGMAVNRIAAELKFDREGIQRDGSFFQHGRRLYSGGYGRSFAYDIAQLAFVLQGTDYQLEKEKLEIFLSYILNGLKFMTKNNVLDIASINREMAREDALKTGLLKRAVEIMLKTEEMPQKNKLQDYMDFINGNAFFEGTKFFNEAMMLCHHTDGLYVGAKFTDNTLWDQDSCNGEAELCFNMTYGTHTCIMKDGSEYMNIMPLWDYSRIPGTTARSESDLELQSKFDKHNWCCDYLPNDHAGGKEENCKALIYEKAQHDFVEAYVTDFAFKGGFVSLGAGIKDLSGKNEVLVTTLDQCFRQGEVIRENNSVLHHGIRYTALCGTKLEYEIRNVRGNWQRINKFAKSKMSEGEIFLLSITHKCENQRCYAYMISSKDIETPKVEVIRNDENIQAILTPDKKVMAVFHCKASFSFGGKLYSGDEKQIIIE